MRKMVARSSAGLTVWDPLDHGQLPVTNAIGSFATMSGFALWFITRIRVGWHHK